MQKYKKLFRSPYAVPNGLQMTDDGLWIVDQITDRVMLVERNGELDYYGVPMMIREIPSDSSNTSGMAWGDDSLWLAANGSADKWRPKRAHDAGKSAGEVLRVDPETGKTISRHPLPNGGGTHGIEYDNHEPGHLWLTTLKDQTLTKMRISDWSVQHIIPLPYTRAHGVVREEDVELVLGRFREEFAASLIRNKMALDTTSATPEETLAEFVEKMGPFFTGADRERMRRTAGGPNV